VDNLHIDSHLAAVVGDDQDADGTAARLKGLLEATPEVALVDDRQVLLDIAGLGHGDDGTIIAHVEDAVLLEDRAEHGLNDDARCRVGDERGLLMELLGEEVDTQVAVLAGGSRSRDADDLAGAALEDQDVAEADVVARDGDGVGGAGSLARGGSAAGLTDLNAGSVALLVEVTHFGFLGANAGRSLDGFLDEVGLQLRLLRRTGRVYGSRVGYSDRSLLVNLLGGRCVDGELDDGLGVLGEGRELGKFDGGALDVGRAGLMGCGLELSAVDSSAGHREVLAVVGLEACAVLALSNVNGRADVALAVDLYPSLGMGVGVGVCVRRLRTG